MLTYKKALDGEIELLELTKRANNSSLPDVEIVDLRKELAHGNKTMISQNLQEKIANNIKKKSKQYYS